MSQTKPPGGVPDVKRHKPGDQQPPAGKPGDAKDFFNKNKTKILAGGAAGVVGLALFARSRSGNTAAAPAYDPNANQIPASYGYPPNGSGVDNGLPTTGSTTVNVKVPTPAPRSPHGRHPKPKPRPPKPRPPHSGGGGKKKPKKPKKPKGKKPTGQHPLGGGKSGVLGGGGTGGRRTGLGKLIFPQGKRAATAGTRASATPYRVHKGGLQTAEGTTVRQLGTTGYIAPSDLYGSTYPGQPLYTMNATAQREILVGARSGNKAAIRIVKKSPHPASGKKRK